MQVVFKVLIDIIPLKKPSEGLIFPKIHIHTLNTAYDKITPTC